MILVFQAIWFVRYLGVIEHYSLPTEWSKQNKMAGVNSRFATISEAEILEIQEDAVPENTKKATKVLLRSMSEYILK